MTECYFTTGTHDDLGDGHDRESLMFPGRMWLDLKIISFWYYPKTYEMMKKVITILEDKLLNYTEPDNWDEDDCHR